MKLRVQRGSGDDLALEEFEVALEPGMVVLDALHRIQASDAPDLAVRWNCKAGKCGSCSAEVNGQPKPMKAFPLVRDLVCDVSWNYEVNKRIQPYQHPDIDDPRMAQEDVDRVQEFRKCIECFLCQDTCHVLREHELQPEFAGPRFLIRIASLEMHPLDEGDRLAATRDDFAIGYCNITKCCTEVCPEHIEITDNGIIPLKERIVDEYYDPLRWLWRNTVGKVFEA